MRGYTRTLAKFSSNLRFQAIPPEVVHLTKLATLDCFGNIVGASKLEFAEKLTGYAAALGDREEATVFGRGFKTSTRSAAFVNGSLAETIEMQDGYTKGGGHPCCGTIPTAVATAEWHRASGRDVLVAIAVGYEIGNRVAASVHTSHLSRGHQPTGTAGTVGAAAAAAKLLRLSEEETYHALGIAGFILPICSGDSMWGGHNVKPIHGGEAAKVGIESAILASRGLRAAPLEGDESVGKGFCRITSVGEPKFEQSLEGLGERYTIQDMYFKPYASCRMNHVPIEVCIGLKQQHQLQAADIERVVVRTYAFAKELVGSVTVDEDSEFTRCQFSMSFAIAMALVHGDVGLDQLAPEALKDKTVHDLAARVQIVVDPKLQALYPRFRPSEFEVVLKNGRTLRARGEFAKGDYRNPMSETEIIDKFLKLAIGVIGRERAQRTVSMVMELDALESLDALIPNLSARTD